MTKRIETMATVFKALADQTRLRILGLLGAGEVCVCDIHQSLGIPQPTTSRHLAYLKRAGLVADRRDGLWVHYRLAEPRDPVLRTVLDATMHSLTHLPTTARDRTRLCCNTGRELPAVEAAPGLPCCEN
ncbi:MAG: metalloregulator ArsR/SmtB family transcription factor [Acidobacteria bacterium]|nr:metalloregulator ArsR/SmtB family transcription factor [Acidobacteriota bacterium]